MRLNQLITAQILRKAEVFSEVTYKHLKFWLTDVSFKNYVLVAYVKTKNPLRAACLVIKRQCSATDVQHQSPSQLDDNRQNFNLDRNKINKQYDRFFQSIIFILSPQLQCFNRFHRRCVCVVCCLACFLSLVRRCTNTQKAVNNFYYLRDRNPFI